MSNCGVWGTGFDRRDAIQQSECRDLVVVPTGSGYFALKLSESHPDFCWHYAGSAALIQYHFNVANGLRKGDAPARVAHATTPVFYAKVENDFSPIDFAVQPKPLENARERLSRLMNAHYRGKDVIEFDGGQIFPGVPCAALLNSDWHRAAILAAPSSTHTDATVFVTLVDYGTEKFVARRDVKPLRREFGRLPPLALRCRMKGVSCNDLEQAKLVEFRRVIKQTGNLVRVELTSTGGEPFWVNLYHPTIEGCNLGSTFYSRALNQAQVAREERISARNARTLESDDDCESTDDEEAGFIIEPPRFVSRFERCDRPLPGLDGTAIVSHVENPAMIYVHQPDQIERVEKMERRLDEMWPSLIPLPPKFQLTNTACVLKPTNSRPACRAVINAISPDELLDVRAVDHGWSSRVQRGDAGDSLKALPREFDRVPQVFLVRLEGLHGDLPPHWDVVRLLRLLLPSGARVRLQVMKSKGIAPRKVRIARMEDGVDIGDLLSQRMREKRVVHPCLDIVPHRPCQVRLLRPVYDPDFRTSVECPFALVKGRLEYSDFNDE